MEGRGLGSAKANEKTQNQKNKSRFIRIYLLIKNQRKSFLNSAMKAAKNDKFTNIKRFLPVF